MENALPPSPTPIAAASVLTRRRSHLDSASYRTLSRLFSHCFHLHPSCSDGSAPAGAEHAAANPTGLDSGDSPQVRRDADFDRATECVGKEVAASGSPSRHVTCSTATEQPSAAKPTGDPGEAPPVALVNMDVPTESTCGKPGAVSEDPVVEARLLVEDEALKSVKACLEGEVDESAEEAVCNNSGHLLLDAMMTNFTGLIDDIGADAMPAQSCVVSQGELQHTKESEEAKRSGDGTEEDRPASTSDCRQVDGGGFEEGEIEGELQDLGADESDSDDEEPGGDTVSRDLGGNVSFTDETRHQSAHSAPEIKGNDPILNKNVDIRKDGQMSVTRAQAVSYDEVLDWNETPLPDNEMFKPGNKRKRHVTEERKAKKTKNKRINRAKKRIADGVHKLKITPVIKPKRVKPCNFYNHGKCQKGDSCNFSHDFVPSTKSKPCTHFATGSCLKGDDCPYDHELSRYPCHKHASGTCNRGDECKFSHVLLTTGVTATTDAKKSDGSLAFRKTNLIEQTSSLKTSMHNREPAIPAPTKQQYSILKTLAGISVDSQQTSSHVPKGVQFLPFGKGGSNSSGKCQDNFSIEKHKNANGSQYQYLGGHREEGQKIAKQSDQKPIALLNEKNSSKEATLTTDCTATPGSIKTQHEVSEASRILQEFLFGAGS